MFFRKKSKIDAGYISPLPNILLCRAIKLHQTDEMFKNNGVWVRTCMFATMSLTMRRHPSFFSDLPKISFQFSEKKDPQPGYFTIFCEQGWLPRDHYQISSLGVNQKHHVMQLLADPERKSGLTDGEFTARLDGLRESFHELNPPADLCDKPFFLFALQTTGDLNFRRSGMEIASVSGHPEANTLLAEHLSETMHKANPDCRVVFLQHPAGAANLGKVKMQGDHIYVPNNRRLRSLDLASSPNCKGVITINSNTLNEALVFSLPVFQMGDFLTDRFPNHFFPYTLEEFLHDPQGCRARAHTKHYLGTIMENQWDLEQLKNPHKLRALIEGEMERKAGAAES